MRKTINDLRNGDAPTSQPDRSTLEKLTNGFRAYIAGWPKQSRDQPGYGINATGFSPGRREISFDFTFLTGHEFCCYDSGCHHGLLLDVDYERLRECFHRAGIEVGRPMIVRMNVACEVGALFWDFSAKPLRHKPLAERIEFDECYDEESAPKAED